MNDPGPPATNPTDAPTKLQSRTTDALAHVVAALATSEDRPGQTEMARLAAQAIESGRHLIVEAGTGTGKTLAYLTAAAVAGKTTIVVTATKALQDQLATKDLPFVAARLAEVGVDIDWAVLKGRSNYLCLQRLRELSADAQTSLDLGDLNAVQLAEVTKLAEWAATSPTGDQAELDWSPSDRAWSSVSVGSDECPGAERCPVGAECFAELARRRAQASDIIVVNTHLYGLDVGSDGAILPDHDVVVFDEAHVIEDVMSDTVGAKIAPGRFITVAQTVRRIIEDPQLIATISDISGGLRTALADVAGQRLDDEIPASIAEELDQAQVRIVQAGEVVAKVDPNGNDDVQQRKLRAQRMLGRTQESLDAVLNSGDGTVAFVSGRPDNPALEIAPLDVGPTMQAGVWSKRTAILTSATIPATLANRVGLDPARTDVADVGSPFDYEHQGILYCALHMPDPRSPGYRDAVADELCSLIEAAGGRTLALFTSWAAMDHAVELVKPRLSVPVLTQRDLPKPALIERFAADTETCLFATTGLFQGVDVPGDTLSLVVIDKIPFPRPNDPLLSARRERLGRDAFAEIDIPRASTLLAQAVGRLIRTTRDRGVVAVLDPRLGKANYRWDIVNALPPMKRTRDRAVAEAFLTELREA